MQTRGCGGGDGSRREGHPQDSHRLEPDLIELPPSPPGMLHVAEVGHGWAMGAVAAVRGGWSTLCVKENTFGGLVRHETSQGQTKACRMTVTHDRNGFLGDHTHGPDFHDAQAAVSGP